MMRTYDDGSPVLADDPAILALREAQEEVDRKVAEMNGAVERWEDALWDAHRLGFTYKELGELLGVSAQRVHQIVTRRRR